MNNSGKFNVTMMKWQVAFPTPHGKEADYRRALAALCRFDTLRPTLYAIEDERLRNPFDSANIPELRSYGDIMLWRTKHPKNWGGIVSGGRFLGAAYLEFEKLRQKYVDPIWSSLRELTSLLKPEYGNIYFCWKDSDDDGHLSIARSAVFRLFFDYYDAGPPGIGARTWFGPDLAAKIGEDLLLEAGARRTDWGGWDLVLFERPWEVSFEEFRDRHAQIEEILRRSGQFGEHDIGIAKPGPNWVPIPRNR